MCVHISCNYFPLVLFTSDAVSLIGFLRFTGGSDEEQPKREDTLAGEDESGKEEKSVSEAKLDEHAEKSRSHIEESGGGDSCHYGEKQVEEMENVQHDSHKSEEEKSRSEEHADESSRASKEEKDKEEQFDSEGNEADNGESKPAGFDKLGEESSDSPNSDAENSDDAPLVIILGLPIL